MLIYRINQDKSRDFWYSNLDELLFESLESAKHFVESFVTIKIDSGKWKQTTDSINSWVYEYINNYNEYCIAIINEHELRK